MDRKTRLLLVSQLDQRRAEVRDYWTWISEQPRGAKILQSISDTIDDMIEDETRSAQARMLALLADCGLLEHMIRTRRTDEPDRSADAGGTADDTSR